MSLPTRQKVRTLRAAVHAKAKQSPSYRFYALYDKVYRADVLSEAYERCRKNGGAAGVDGQTFDDIEAYGVEQWLGELATPKAALKNFRARNPQRSQRIEVANRSCEPADDQLFSLAQTAREEQMARSIVLTAPLSGCRQD